MPDLLDLHHDPTDGASVRDAADHYEMDDSLRGGKFRSASRQTHSGSVPSPMPLADSGVETGPVKGLARHTLGLLLLLCVVFLWTLSNFLGSVG